MMLSVFYVHNIVPGPGLFRDQMDFVMAFYLCLLILNVIALLFLIFANRPLLKVVSIPNRFLGMTILTLSFVGVYSLRNSFTDCIMAACFGLLGMVLRRLDLPVYQSFWAWCWAASLNRVSAHRCRASTRFMIG